MSEILIQHLIIHELEKEPEHIEARLFLAEAATPLDSRADLLVEKLNHTFLQKEDILHGYLSPPGDALFPGYFQHLVDEQLTKEAFIDFSRDTMNALQLNLQGVVGAKGGYLVYAIYEVENTRMLGVFLVRDTEGLAFRKEGEDAAAFLLDTVTYLNTDKLAMACRIHLNRFEEGEGRFVELIKHARSQKEISEYFVSWIGLERPESSKTLTQSFLQMVEELPMPVDESTGEQMEEGRFREKVLNFAMQSPQKTINLEHFGQELYGDPEATKPFLQDKEVGLDNEFRFDRNTMKQFYNYKANAEGIYIYFNRNHLNHQQVRIEGDTVIIQSPELAEQILDILGDKS
ncbi:MAG: nucleoid-associated protein [Phaeodactylibacter sp.]|nr:nucleoid-associated protein [Phaeodactylibacter sp.]